MKAKGDVVSVRAGDLRAALALADRSVATRSMLPVLANVKLDAIAGAEQGDGSDARMAVTCTNLETATTVWIEARAAKAWATTVPARTLVDLAGNLPDDDVAMSLNERTNTLNVKAGRFESNLHGIDASEFPLVQSWPFQDWAKVEMGAGALNEYLGRVLHAASIDESRPILTGVLLEVKDGHLTLAAADGFRLAVMRCNGFGADDGGKGMSVIVPARALGIAQRVLARAVEADKDAVVGIYVSPSRAQVAFVTPTAQVVAQLIDGNFPDYTQIVPKKSDLVVEADPKALVGCLKAATVFARESNNQVRLVIEPGTDEPGKAPGTIAVRARSAETGDNEGTMDAVIEGNGLEIAFNVKYLMDALQAGPGGTIRLGLTTANSPVLVRPAAEGDGDVGWMAVVMPMHIA